MTPEGCYFYHTIELPAPYGLQLGEWDLREHIEAYTGFEPLAGRTVLEVGAANGGVTFWMEEQGATVWPLDLSPSMSWDLLPDVDADMRAERAVGIQAINEAFAVTRSLLHRKSVLLFGSAYTIEESLRAAGFTSSPDIVTFGSVLLHLRDPLGALLAAAKVKPQTFILTDVYPQNMSYEAAIAAPMAIFAAATYSAPDTWWHITPYTYAYFLYRLGYSEQRIIDHRQWYYGSPPGAWKRAPVRLWTLVATRSE